MRAWWIALALGCAAASAPATVPAPPDAPSASPVGALLALPPPLQARWRSEARADRSPPMRRLERLVEFVFAPEGLGMRYREGATHSVADAWTTREANCLGFTLLFLALARDAGLDAMAQEVDRTLSWSQHEGTVYRGSHVNVSVRIGTLGYTLDVLRDALPARHRPRRISDQRLLAHYYNSRAIEHLARAELDPALRLMQQALAQDPGRAAHWSNLGVLRLRNGDADGAARAYRQALRRDPRNVEALFNSVSLAQRRGEASVAAGFRARLLELQQRDPFHLFLRALDHERAGELAQAIAHYRRAIRLDPHEARFHLALAQAYRRAGDTRHAERAAARAQALAARTAAGGGGR